MTMIHSTARRVGLSSLILSVACAAPLALSGCGNEGGNATPQDPSKATAETEAKIRENMAKGANKSAPGK